MLSVSPRYIKLNWAEICCFLYQEILNERIRDNFLRSTSIDEIGKDILIRTGQTIQVKLCWEWTYLTKQNKNAHWILFSKIVCGTRFDSRPHLPNWRNISQCVASLGVDAYGKKLNNNYCLFKTLVFYLVSYKKSTQILL